MNSRERILAAFKYIESDKVPVSIHVLDSWFNRADEKLANDIITHTDPIVSVFLNKDYEIVLGKRVKEFLKIENNKKQTKIMISTKNGYLTQTIDHGIETDWVVEYFFKTTDDINKFLSFPYEPFDINSIDSNEFMHWNKIIKNDGLIVLETPNPAYLLYSFIGPMNYYFLLKDNFDLVKNFTSIMEERIINYIKVVLEVNLIETPVFKIIGQEILGKPMASLNYYYELVVPYDKAIIKLIHNSGGLAYVHMHGNTRDILNNIIEMQVDAMSPFEEPPAGDITLKEVKQKFLNKICIIGNLDDMQVLAVKDKNNIKIKALKAILEIAPGGGYILGGTDSSIYDTETTKSFLLMGELSNEFGLYPLDIKKIKMKLSSLEN